MFAGVELIAGADGGRRELRGRVARGAGARRLHHPHAGPGRERDPLARRHPAPRRGLRAGRGRAAPAGRGPVQHDGRRAPARAARERGVRAPRPDGAAPCGPTCRTRRRSSPSPTACTCPTWQDPRVPAALASDEALEALRRELKARPPGRDRAAHRRAARPRRADRGGGAARGDLQAPRSRAPRHRAGRAPPEGPAAPAGLRRQGAPRRSRGQGHGDAARPRRSASGRTPRSSSRTTTWASRAS